MGNLVRLPPLSSVAISVSICMWLLAAFLISPVQSGVVRLSDANFASVVGASKFSIVNFYADWCRFSQMLHPVFANAAIAFEGNSDVVFGSVDCDANSDVVQKYHISKYPTLKVFRYGELAKKEYRGQRSKEAFLGFVQEQLHDQITIYPSVDQLVKEIDPNRGNVYGLFTSHATPEYGIFSKVAYILRDECRFSAVFGAPAFNQSVMFRPIQTTSEPEVKFPGSVTYELLLHWATEQCVPVVRELTFENAEELTEEGRPFLILFVLPDDKKSVKLFTDQVLLQLPEQSVRADPKLLHLHPALTRNLYRSRNSCRRASWQTNLPSGKALFAFWFSEFVTEGQRRFLKLREDFAESGLNCLVADGKKFSHPLHHLQKTEEDLPLIVIDNFRHMFLFPNFKDLEQKPGALRQFANDFHSGKLHREFHHGPDFTTTSATETSKVRSTSDVDVDSTQPTAVSEETTAPVESVFRKLKPSSTRYTVLRDEL